MNAHVSAGKQTLAAMARGSSGRVGRSARIRGITLIEVILAITTVAVLATMSVSSYSKYRERARNAQAVADIGAIQSAIANWSIDNQGRRLSPGDATRAFAKVGDPWG